VQAIVRHEGETSIDFLGEHGYPLPAATGQHALPHGDGECVRLAIWIEGNIKGKTIIQSMVILTWQPQSGRSLRARRRPDEVRDSVDAGARDEFPAKLVF
jgi:hypothetical protein